MTPTRLALLLAAGAALSGCASTKTDDRAAPPGPGRCSLQELAWTRAASGAEASRVPPERDETEAALEGAPIRVLELTKRRDALRILDVNGKLICERSDRSAIERVYADPVQRTALVISAPAKGATRSRAATWVSLDACKSLMPPLAGESPAVDPASAKMTFPPSCEQGATAEEAQCTSAQVFALDADCLPRFLSVESSALTEREIGVAFDGTHTIRHPRTERAEIVR